ncbi:MAG: hypothetical protein R3F30_06110 [Planctomycetota bacterium]
MRHLVLPACLLAAAAAPAQNYIETFPFPDGTGTTVKIPLWTPQTGNWVITNKRLVYQSGATFGYITTDRYKGVADFVLDVDVFYGATQNLYYGGLVGRHPGSSATSNFVYCKLQDNAVGGTGAFNSVWMYENPGGANYYAVSPSVKSGTMRLIVKGATAWADLDTNMDGIFEYKGAPRTLTTVGASTGLIGIAGYNATELDNFKYYRGVLLADATTTPKIGTTYKMVFSAPLENGNPTPWLGLCALGRAGIPIPGGTLPLSLDALLVNSFGFGWSGILTSTTPEATLQLPVPNDTGLVGLDFFVAALTLSGGGAASISNDHHVKIVQ